MGTVYKRVALTGGGAYAVDGIGGVYLSDGDVCFATAGGVFYYYIYDADNGQVEASPDRIKPDTGAGAGRWIMQAMYPVNAVTASVDELNIMNGVTASTAELNLLDGSIAGTAVASKALALGANKNVDTLVIGTLGLSIGSGAGTAVTATAAELNILDGVTATYGELNWLVCVTPGTATASRALVLGADKNVDTLAIAQNGLCIGSGAGTAVTATAAELNILDGVTATATELNYIAGVTSNIQTQLDAKEPDDASLTFDGIATFGVQEITAGRTTAITSNTVILSANAPISATYTIGGVGVDLFVYDATGKLSNLPLGGGGTFDGTNNQASFTPGGGSVPQGGAYLHAISVSATRFIVLSDSNVMYGSV